MAEFINSIKSFFHGTYTLRIAENFIALFAGVAPYLLISIALNVAVSRYFRPRQLSVFRGNRYVALLLAAAFGLLSPMPTYAALPIAVSLYGAGLPFAAMMAFVIASPLMNPSIFFLTATQMGTEMALVRAGAAFAMAVAGGLLAERFLTPPVPQDFANSEKPPRPLATEIYRAIRYNARVFSIAILISSAVKAFIKPETISLLLGKSAAAGTLIAIAMGVPLYTCGGAAIPLMMTLQEMGMGKGPILAFFLSGPATKAETLYAYQANMGMRTVWFFLALTLFFSFLFGVLYSTVR